MTETTAPDSAYESDAASRVPETPRLNIGFLIDPGMGQSK
jgi:hypothetical protein